MSQILIHPELIELFGTLQVADLDYEDNRGSSNVYEFADRARRAQKAFRDRKAELEAEGVEIWGAEPEPTKFLEFSCRLCKGEGRVTCEHPGQSSMACPMCGGSAVAATIGNNLK